MLLKQCAVSLNIMQNRYHILLLTSSYPASTEDSRSSAGLFVKDFAHELSKKMKVTVITENTQKAGEGPPASLESGFRVIRFPWAGMDRPLSTLRFPKDLHLIFSVIFGGIWAASKFSRINQVDVALALWAIPSGVWALLLKWLHGIPFVVWCLGSDIWDYGRKPITNQMLCIILRQAMVLFADGYQLKDDVQSLSGKKCLFLPSSRRLPIDVSAKANIIPGKLNYLFIGRYHPNKGPDLLIEAIAKLDPSIKEKVHFHLFGGGHLEKRLRRMIDGENLSNVITMNGYIDQKDAVAYLKACDGLIIPSRVESIPVVLSDALQTGCPVLVSDVGDMGKLVRKYRAGIAFPPNSPTKLADAIEKGFANKEDYTEGRRRLFEIFDLSRSVESFVETTFRNFSR